MPLYGLRLLVLLLTLVTMAPLQAMDTQRYRAIAQDSIRQTSMGVAGDIDQLLLWQRQLMALGLEGAEAYVRAYPEATRPLRLVIDQAEDMTRLSLAEMETQWHQGQYLADHGMDSASLDHFGSMMSLMDTIIHPATAYVCLQRYKHTGDPDMLFRARAELVEVLQHLRHIAPGKFPTVELTRAE